MRDFLSFLLSISSLLSAPGPVTLPAAPKPISLPCTLDLLYLLQHPNDPVATQMSQASGKGPMDWGDYGACKSIPFAHYCFSMISAGSIQFSIGSCIPKTCDDDDSATLISTLAATALNITGSATSHCGDNSYPMTTSRLFIILFLACFPLLTLAATCTDLCCSKSLYKKWLSMHTHHHHHVPFHASQPIPASEQARAPLSPGKQTFYHSRYQVNVNPYGASVAASPLEDPLLSPVSNPEKISQPPSSQSHGPPRSIPVPSSPRDSLDGDDEDSSGSDIDDEDGDSHEDTRRGAPSHHVTVAVPASPVSSSGGVPGGVPGGGPGAYHPNGAAFHSSARRLGHVSASGYRKRLQKSVLGQMFLQFSLVQTLQELGAASAAKAGGRTEMLNAIRVLSMCWVVMGHSLVFQLTSPGFSNIGVIFPPNGWLSQWWFQVVPGAFFAVDTFFWMSGFLVGFTLLKYLRRDATAIGWGKIPSLYLLRWLRLTPVLGVVVLFYWQIFGMVSGGPLWGHSSDAEACGSYGWSTILYVNNLIPKATTEGKYCLGHTWYLQCDFQFFLLAPFLVLLYFRTSSRRLAPSLFLFFILTLASTLANIFLANHYHLEASPALTTSDEFSILYIKPWTRIQPYLIGVLTAILRDYQKYEQNGRWAKWRMSATQILLSWTIAFTIVALCVYSTVGLYATYPLAWPQWKNTTFLALSRLGFGIAMSLFVYVGLLGQGGLIQKLFSLHFWEPLSKLTYGAYLVHPILIYYVYNSEVKMDYVHMSGVVFRFVSFTVMAYAVSFSLFVCVEQPLAGVVGLLMGKKKK